MIESLVNKLMVRDFIDSFPEHNRFIRFARVIAKALLFRKRIIKGRRIIFEGVEDAVCRTFIDVGAGRGEVLIETIFTAISPGTERGYYLDLANFHQERPHLSGYSGMGRIRAIGKKVNGFKKGEMVAGIFKHSSLNVVNYEEVVRVPKGVDYVYASFITLGVIALTGIRAAGIENGQKIIVMGQGILGQLVDQMTRLEGASNVIAIALTESKKNMSLQSGVDEFIALNQYQDKMSSIAADVIIDVTGSLKGFENSLEIVKPGGRVVMLGSIPGYSHEGTWAEKVVTKQIEVCGAHVRNLEDEGLTYKDEARRFLQLLADKKLKMDHLITDIYDPEKAPEIYQRLAKGDRDMVGVVIDWEG